jgi:hypothetical protein
MAISWFFLIGKAQTLMTSLKVVKANGTVRSFRCKARETMDPRKERGKPASSADQS